MEKTLQEKIFSSIRKKSFTASNLTKIVRKIIIDTNSTSFDSFDLIDSTISLNAAHFAKKITEIYKSEKIVPKYSRSLSKNRQRLIKKYYDIFRKEHKMSIPFSSFEYIFNQMISRISKDVKSSTLEKLKIFKVGDTFDAYDYALSTGLIEEEEQESIEEFLEEEQESTEESSKSVDLESFRTLVIESLHLKKEQEFTDAESTLTDKALKEIIDNNFDGDIQKAIDYIRGDVQKYRKEFHNSIRNIHGFKKATNLLSKNIVEGKVLIICDNDLDGSSAIAGINVAKKTLPKSLNNNIQVEYAKILPNSDLKHGLNFAHIEYLAENNLINPEEITLLQTADNGMSLPKEEVDKILNILPNATLLITDHHLPSEELVSEGYKNRVFFCNPKFKPNEYFKENKNISGAQINNEIYVDVLKNLKNDFNLFKYQEAINVINTISYSSNSWDYVNSDISQYIEKDYLSDKLSSLGTLMNTINNMNTLLGKKLDAKALSELLNIDISEAEKMSNSLLYLNNISKSFIEIYNEYFLDNEKLNSLDSNIFEDLFSKLYLNFDITERDINYIALLRPLMIEIASNKYKTIYEANFLDKLENVFKDLKKIQTKIVDQIKENPLNFIEDIEKHGLETDNVLIMVKKDSKNLKKININRKLLNIAFPNSDKSFKIIFDGISNSLLTGSARSILNRSELLKDKKNIEDILDVSIEMKGHENAFGFFFEFNKKLNKNVRFKTISQFIKWLDLQIQNKNVLLEEKQLEPVNIYPTEQVELLLKINSLFKSSFQGKKGVDVFLYFDDYQIEDFEEELKKTKTGWMTLDTRIMSSTLIMERGLLAKYIELRKSGNKNVSMEFSTLSSGAFIVKGIRNNPNDIKIQQHTELHELYKDYQEKEYRNNIEKLTNLEMQNRPFIQFDKNGDISFRRLEGTRITLMHQHGTNAMHTVDVEGTELAMTAQITEISISTQHIDPKSGHKLSKEEYLERSFIVKGREVLVDLKDLSHFEPLDENDLELYSDRNLFFNEEMEQWYYNPKIKYYPEVFSKKIEDNKVIYNQQLIETHAHAYISDLFSNIPTAIESLTHLTNDFVKNSKNSLTREEADKFFAKHLKKFGFSILSAHNLSYDYSLIRSNLPETFKVFEDLLLWDSAATAQTVRHYSQTFASIELPIEVGSLTEKPRPIVVFENRYGNGASLEEFFEKIENKEFNIEIGDKDKVFFLKVKNDKLMFIDSKEDIELVLFDDIYNKNISELKDALKFKTDNISVPPKYSVQSLLTEKYVKMMLQKTTPIQSFKINTDVPGIIVSHTYKTENGDEIYKLKLFEKEFTLFLENYRFDNSMESNIEAFFNFLKSSAKKKNQYPNIEVITKNLILQHIPYKPPFGGKYLKREEKKHINLLYNQFEEKIYEQISEFISLNKNISAFYTSRFLIEKIVTLLPDNLDRINESVISHIHHVTSYSKEIILNTVSMVKEFQKLNNGVNLFSIAEIHNNLIGKIPEHIGDSDLENDLVVTQVLDEVFNYLNKNRFNQMNLALDKLKLDFITTAKKDKMKIEQEDITTSSINTATFRGGKKILEKNETGYQSSFYDKIEKTLNSNKQLLKVNNKLVQSKALIYVSLDKDVSDKKIKEITEELETYLFLEVLKNSKRKINKFLTNLINNNKNNFSVRFSEFFPYEEFEEIYINADKAEKVYIDYCNEHGIPEDFRLPSRYFKIIEVDFYKDLDNKYEEIEQVIKDTEIIIENMPKDNQEEINEFNSYLSSLINFKKELGNVYEKATSLKMINEFEDSVSKYLEMDLEDFISKYNISFDYYTANRKAYIINELFELLEELFKIDSDSYEDFTLSGKFTNRGKKDIQLQYIEPEEALEFREETLVYFSKFLKKMNFNEEYNNKIERHFDVLFKYFFINEELAPHIPKDELVEKYINNEISNGEKTFMKPSREIPKFLETSLGTKLAGYIIETVKNRQNNDNKVIEHNHSIVKTSKSKNNNDIKVD